MKMFPSIHLNGTGAHSLQEQYLDASHAVDQAITALYKSAPHGRDYYPQGDNAINDAINEHDSRLERLVSVKKELDELAIHCFNNNPKNK